MEWLRLMQQTRCGETLRLEHLPWDSAHFGFPVARLHGDRLEPTGLRRALESARDDDIRLVYCAARNPERVPDRLLLEFGGDMVDRKATFTTWINDRKGDEPQGCYRSSEHPKSLPADRLVALAVTAGSYSRFRRDPRIPAGTFQRLYEEWITRSTLGELADGVLLAAARGAPENPIAFVTVSIEGLEGAIGLIAVEQDLRGRGIGSIILRCGHRWLAERGARSVSVVTQFDNRPACRLYEKAGYQLTDLKFIYHFWPQEPFRAGNSQDEVPLPLPERDCHGAT